MTLTRKRSGRREVLVRNHSYIWRIEMEDSWLYVQERDHILLGRLQVFPADHLANQLIVHVSEPMLESSCGTSIVTSRIVSRLIEGALDRGWISANSGLTIDVAEAQEILEAYFQAKPASQKA